MIANVKVKALLLVIEVLLITFQIITICLAHFKEYYLIYEWIFYVINYVIIILLCLPYGRNRIIKWSQLFIGLIFLTANTIFFHYLGNVNLVVSSPQNNQHELILKEYKNMNYETVRIRRRWVIFGKKVDTLIGSSDYKTIEKGTYKIEWVSGDSSILTYQADSKGTLEQNILSFRSTNYISYENVLASLTGKWIENGYPNNYFMFRQEQVIYAKDGRLYYYSINNTKQQDVTSIIVSGDGTKPSFTVVLNSDCVIGSNGLIKNGGTITISPVTLAKSESNIYSRQ